MKDKRGQFITLEGGEGSGKSTQIAFLTEFLRSWGYNVKVLREPGGTPIGEEIRHTLKHSPNGSSMCLETELLLMNASRAQIVRELILPSLERGEIVLCDRFYDSTTAYQGYGRGLPLNLIKEVIYLATGGLKPNLTLLLNANPEQGAENMKKRQADMPFKLDRLDSLERDFHKRVYEGYQKIAMYEPERVKIIPYIPNDDDGSKTHDLIKRTVLEHLNTTIKG